MDGRQALAKYIREHYDTQADFARAVKCSEGHLSLVLQGKKDVSVPLGKRISTATAGTVPLHALVNPTVGKLIRPKVGKLIREAAA